MARIFITGSTDGLGLLAAQMLLQEGHEVVLHARNEQRAKEALLKISEKPKVLIADLSRMDEIKLLAQAVNALGEFDAIIHNAGVYEAAKKSIFMVNTLAPYMLTCLIKIPKRLIYISSGMHLHGDASMDHISLSHGCSYSDSKLYLLMLAKAVARHYPHCYVNTVDPGWVPTKMGGAGAPDDLEKGAMTQVWLSVSDDAASKVSGCYFFHQKAADYLAQADDPTIQNKLLLRCEKFTGVRLS